MCFLFVLKKTVRELVQYFKSYGLLKASGENYVSAVKNDWGWELLPTIIAGAERVKDMVLLKLHKALCP